MTNPEGPGRDDDADSSVEVPPPGSSEWSNFADEDIMHQKNEIHAVEAEKILCVGDKSDCDENSLLLGDTLTLSTADLTFHGPSVPWNAEPLSALAAEYQSGSSILLEKIKVLDEQYAAIRRTRGDGNCFFRSFMFSYLEHILVTQDKAEVDRIKAKVEDCRKTLQSLGYVDFTFEDFFAMHNIANRRLGLDYNEYGLWLDNCWLFLEQLESVLQGHETSISHDELLLRSQDQSVSDYVVMFFRFVTSAEIRKRSEFFEPFIMGLANTTVEQFCKSSVEPMGEESDHVHIIAISDALGVPIRVVYLDRSSCDNGGVSVNHHDFVPNVSSSSSGAVEPFITLLYRPGHYDMLYPK